MFLKNLDFCIIKNLKYEELGVVSFLNQVHYLNFILLSMKISYSTTNQAIIFSWLSRFLWNNLTKVYIEKAIFFFCFNFWPRKYEYSIQQIIEVFNINSSRHGWYVVYLIKRQLLYFTSLPKSCKGNDSSNVNLIE